MRDTARIRKEYTVGILDEEEARYALEKAGHSRADAEKIVDSWTDREE